MSTLSTRTDAIETIKRSYDMRTQISQMIKVVQKGTAALLMLFFGKTKPAQVVKLNTAC